jgi:hypothetical protein
VTTYVFSIKDCESHTELDRVIIPRAESQEQAEQYCDENLAARSMWFVYRELVDTHEDKNEPPTL